MRRAILALLLAALAAACGGGSTSRLTPTPRPSAVATATPTAIPSPATPSSSASKPSAQQVEADADPTLPGAYVNLPAIYRGYYGNQSGPNTNAHTAGPVDYSAQGLPPAGGPHWGSGRCADDPASSPPNCGPVPWGIYREPWPAESLVHNMEHAGVVIWYHTPDAQVVNGLESFARQQLVEGRMLVLVPYPDMPDGTIAITVWSRRDEFPVEQYTPERLAHFIDVLYCRFDPERFCRPVSGGLTA